MPEDNHHMRDDEICEVRASDEFLDIGVSFGGHPRANTALDVHPDRGDLE